MRKIDKIGDNVLLYRGDCLEEMDKIPDKSIDMILCYSVRLLTPKECAKLQGFPESYCWPKENEKQVYKQIGNSVCVPVVKRIADNIVLALQQEV